MTRGQTSVWFVMGCFTLSKPQMDLEANSVLESILNPAFSHAWQQYVVDVQQKCNPNAIVIALVTFVGFAK